MSVCGSSCLNSFYFCFSCCSLSYSQPCIPLSSPVSPFSLTSEWCCQIWSLSEGQDNSEETQSPWSALQPVTTIYFLVPHIHPDPRLCDITRGLNPQAPQARDHKSGGWQIRLVVKENRVGCVRCRISPFLILSLRWGLKVRRITMVYLHSIFPIMFGLKVKISKSSSFGWKQPVMPTKCNKIFSVYLFILGTQWKPLFKQIIIWYFPCQLLKLW